MLRGRSSTLDTEKAQTLSVSKGGDGISAKEKQLVKAQCFAISYLHHYLPVYPACWVIRKLDAQFLVVYIKERRQYGTLKCLAAAAFFALFLPYAYAHTIMAYPCNAKMEMIGGNHSSNEAVEVRETDCGFQDWMRSPKCFLLGGSSLVLACVGWAGMNFLMGDGEKWIDVQLYRLMGNYGNQYLPRVFYNGLGRMGTRHSAKSVFSDNGMEAHYSWMHDLFGTFDYAMICIVLAISMCTSTVVIGYKLAGIRAVPVAGLFGYAIALIEFYVMNSVLGASDHLIEMVSSELRMFQPESAVLEFRKLPPTWKPDTMAMISQAVERAAARFDLGNNSEHTNIAALIRAEGKDVLKSVVTRLSDRAHARYMSRECCLRLQTARQGIFAGDHYTFDSLSIMDMNALLNAYFDPGLSLFPVSSLSLMHVYIPVPVNINCTLAGTAGWKVEDMDDMQATLATQEQDFNAKKRGHGALQEGDASAEQV